MAVAAALLAASAIRLPSLVSTLLAAYLALVANVGLVTLVLSPFHAVTAGGLAGAELVLFVAALGAWWVRGRAGLPLAPGAAALREAVADPLTVLMLVVVACVLAYELLLVLTVPANNWDSLTYHLTRAAFWTQQHGVEWIANAPTDRQNEFQPLAEQEVFFLFAATGTGVLYAVPQYLAELAILVAVYGASRRLGFGVRGSVGSACLLSTFALVTLEATTAQNDLVAASTVAVAACLLLGTAKHEAALAGVALGLGLGVKLTTVLVWPVLAVLAWTRGRAAVFRAAAGAVAGFVLVGLAGYVLNLEHTGHLLGRGGGRTENTTSPSFPGSVHTVLHVLYRLFDLSSLSNRLIAALAAAAVVAVLMTLLHGLREGRSLRDAGVFALVVTLPLLSPLIAIEAAKALGFVARVVHLPVAGSSGFGQPNRKASEDYAAFGPLGSMLLLGAAVWGPVAHLRGRADGRRLALALALPCFLVLLSLEAKYNIFLTRYVLVAAVLVAPLFAGLFRSATLGAALVVAGSAVAFVTLRDNLAKPFAVHPWTMSQAEALRQTWQPQVGGAIDAYRRLVPAHACVGAIVGGDEPAYVLWGPGLDHRVTFLPPLDPLPQVYRRGLFYVVISPVSDAPSADQLRAAGWSIRPLGSYWLLATAPHAGAGECA